MVSRLKSAIPPTLVAPAIDLRDRADDAALNPLDDSAIVVSGMNLDAHLCRQLVLGGQLSDDASLGDCVRERLLAIDMLAQLQGGRRGGGMRVVGRRHDDGVNLILLGIQHFPIVTVPPCLRINFGGPIQEIRVNVAQGDDVLVGQLLHVVPALVSTAYNAKVQLLLRRFGFGGGQTGTQKNRRPRCRR